MRVTPIVGLGLAVLALLAVAESPAAGAATRNCGSVINYPKRPDIVTIKASGTSCATAKRLIDATFLKGNWPYGATRWSYSGWTWTQRPNGDDVMSARVKGVREDAIVTVI